MAALKQKNLSNLQNLICCQCLKLRSDCPILLVNMIFNYSPIMQELRGFKVKSNIGELTWSTSSTLALDLIVFTQKSHVLKDKRLDIS